MFLVALLSVCEQACVCVKQKCVLLSTHNVIQIIFNLKNICDFVELCNWTDIVVTFLTGNELGNKIM
jgi:hypothetical protein